MAETLDHRLVTTRTDHQCHGCSRSMPSKSKMYRWAVAQEGTVHSGYTCVTCAAIVAHYPYSYWDWEMDFSFGYINEHILNCDHHGKTPEQFLSILKNTTSD